MPTSKEEMIRRGLTPHDIQHSQHRRAEWQDYRGRGLYMVTLCIEGRRPLFGCLEGSIRARRETPDFPHIVLSPLGLAIVNDELPKIHCFYPEIELWKATVMPDHLHLLLFVDRPLPDKKTLGDIIRRFKGGCTRAWWAAEGALSSSAPSPAECAAVPALSSAVQQPPSPPSAPLPKGPSLFEPGYHDRIIKRPGMLDTIKRYMSDNPLRALMRRQLPRLMERRLHLRIGAHEYAAFGALFLLKRAEKIAVFFHRRDKATGVPTELTDEFRRQQELLLAEAANGVVLVSPAISKGEKAVIDRAIGEGLPVIHLQKEPIADYWKPERRRFEACARGVLLILSPWGLDEELMKRRGAAGAVKAQGAAGAALGTALESAGTPAAGQSAPSDYERFHRLNDLAEEICNTSAAVLMDIKDYQ